MRPQSTQGTPWRLSSRKDSSGSAQGQSTTPSTLRLMAVRTASASRPGSSSELKMMIW